MVLIGEKELRHFLKDLPKRVIKKGLKLAVNSGATPIVRETRRNAPVVSGLMKKSVRKKIKSYPTGNAIAIIGADRSIQGTYRGKKRVPANYWHLVLGGVQPHATGEGSQVNRSDRNNRASQSGRIHPGFKGRNILADAVTKTASQVKSIMEKKLKEVIAREAAKLAKK